MYNGDFEAHQVDIETWKSEFHFKACMILLLIGVYLCRKDFRRNWHFSATGWFV